MVVTERKLQARFGGIENKDDMFREIQRVWTSIKPQYVQSLYNTIPRRLQIVIQLNCHLICFIPYPVNEINQS